MNLPTQEATIMTRDGNRIIRAFFHLALMTGLLVFTLPTYALNFVKMKATTFGKVVIAGTVEDPLGLPLPGAVLTAEATALAHTPPPAPTKGTATTGKAIGSVANTGLLSEVATIPAGGPFTTAGAQSIIAVKAVPLGRGLRFIATIGSFADVN